jgi:NhaA family Na+:H+ antiporter
VITPRRFLPTSTVEEQTFLGRLLRQETVGGAIVLVAAVVAVLWANSPWSEEYVALQRLDLGPLDLQAWASDGALTLFFYVAGLELKREFVVGSLRTLSDALVPVVAAVAGVATPAAIYAAVNSGWGPPGGRLEGWAVPAATDIAFALAVLAVVGRRRLPGQLRAFLLTLAVVDDLVVIAIIAVFYTSTLHLVPLLVALGGLVVFAALQRYRGESWLWYVPLTLVIWWFTHESGIHATVAGVAMGLLTRVRPDAGEAHSPAEVLEHKLTPVSAGFAVPLFALMSAGVAVGSTSELLTDPIALGVVAGLLIGKPVGVFGGAWVVTRVTRAKLNAELSWRDIAAVSVLAGIGFTVALLVSELSFAGQDEETAKTAVLAGSVLAALLASAVLGSRGRSHAAKSAPVP